MSISEAEKEATEKLVNTYRIWNADTGVTLGWKAGTPDFVKQAAASLELDRPAAASNNIMENKEGNNGRENSNRLRNTDDVHPESTGRAGDDVSQREQTLQEHERQGQEGTGRAQGEGSGALGKELNLAGLSGLRGMAHGYPGGNSGSVRRLSKW